MKFIYDNNGDDMRMFYIFDIKDDIKYLYKDNPNNLFKILNSIYYMHLEDVNYGFNLFNQITNKIKVLELSNKIYIDMHQDLIYSKHNNEHIINDLFHDEVSILKIKKSHLLIQSNKSYNSFFNYLLKNHNNYFVCDFLEKDFFFLEDMKSIVK